MFTPLVTAAVAAMGRLAASVVPHAGNRNRSHRF
jgi:hypothetical protein